MYDFKKLQELGWAVATAVGTAVAAALVMLDFSTLNSEQAIKAAILGIIAAAIRAGGGALFSFKSTS